MAKRRLAALFLSIAIAMVLPTIALAASNSSSGLVPCGASSSADEATSCQACNIVELSQNVIMFMIGLSIPIAIALFAYAGILYFTSGMGGSENISKAKTIFRSAVFGFVLAISAWLIVNTLLYTILSDEYKQNSSWFKIDCSVNRQITGNIQDVLKNTLGVAPDKVTLESPIFLQPTLVCPAGYIPTTQGMCSNGKEEVQPLEIIRPDVVATGGSLNSDQISAALNGTYGYQAQLQAICVQQGLSDCRLAQAIMAIESNGYAGAYSGAGAVGLMQLMPTTACSLNS